MKRDGTIEKNLSLSRDVLYRDLGALEQRLPLPVTQSFRNRGESTPCNTLKSTSSSESLPRVSRPNFRKSCDPSSEWPLEEPVATNFRSLRPTLFENTWTRYEEKSPQYLTLSLVFCLARLCFASSIAQCCLLRNVFSIAKIKAESKRIWKIDNSCIRVGNFVYK